MPVNNLDKKGGGAKLRHDSNFNVTDGEHSTVTPINNSISNYVDNFNPSGKTLPKDLLNFIIIYFQTFH